MVPGIAALIWLWNQPAEFHRLRKSNSRRRLPSLPAKVRQPKLLLRQEERQQHAGPNKCECQDSDNKLLAVFHSVICLIWSLQVK